MAHAKRRPLLLAILLLNAACGRLEDEPVLAEDAGAGPDALGNAIIGGTTDSGHDAVAMLYYDDGPNSYLCSGTLIDKDVYLTAGHCIETTNASKYYVLGGTNLNASAPDWYRGATLARHHPAYNGNFTHDVGIVVLDQEAPVTPYRWLANDEDDVYDVGTGFTAVGYGASNGNGGGSGIKRTVDLTITEVYADLFLYGSSSQNTCSGDSGGPALKVIDGYVTVIGVVSFGDQYCSQFGGNMRTDDNRAFIETYASPKAGKARVGGGGGGGDNPFACSVAGAAAGPAPGAIAAGILALAAATFRRRRAAA